MNHSDCPCDVRYLDFGMVCRGTALSARYGWVLIWRDEDGARDPDAGLQGMSVPASHVILPGETWPDEWEVCGVQTPDLKLRPITEEEEEARREL